MDLSERYTNQLRVKGFETEHHIRLQEAKVLVVGAGGLGCPVLRQLAVLGIGNITVIDDDKISLSNLNRQTLFLPREVGKFKVEVAREKLLDLNPDTSVHIHINRLTSKNVQELTKEINVVIDCTDNLATRYILDRVCQKNQVPLIFGGVRMMEGQFGVFNYQQSASFADVFSPDGYLESLEDCNSLGTFGFVCELIASYQVAEVMKIVTGIGQVNSGVITTIDLSENLIFKAKKN